MNTDEMRYFLAVYEGDSISQAADKLHISPQGLGKSLKRFEKKLGVRLFVRTPLGIVPTDDARFIAEMSKRVISTEDEMLEYLTARRRAIRTRHFMGRDSMLGDVIALGIADYNETHPNTPIETVFSRTSEDVQAKAFIDNGYDYRFLSEETDVLPELPHEKLCVLKFVAVMNKESRMAQIGSLKIEDLRNLTLLTENANFAWMKLLGGMCAKRGFDLTVRELDQAYIIRLLSQPDDMVFFAKKHDASRAPWNSEDFTVVECDPPFQTNIILQTTEASVDPELLACIKNRLAESTYR